MVETNTAEKLPFFHKMKPFADDIVLTNQMTAGSIQVENNFASVAALGDFLADSKTGGTVRVFNNKYTSDA
tara:strand:+ start:38 stop:250 length:213 start_codon:yes stop_codon:yes gene_type:complete